MGGGRLGISTSDGSVANDCIVFRLTPVHPPAVAPPYPPGTIVDTDNNTIILPGGVEQRVWFDLRLSNWGCVGPLRGWQATIGTDSELPAGVLGIYEPCADPNDASECTALGFGPLGYPGADCHPEPSNYCSNVWQDGTRSDWLAFKIALCAPGNRACGGTTNYAPDVEDDGLEHYAMSVVLAIDASFVGTVEIPLIDNILRTFVFFEERVEVAAGKLIPATVIVPTGACCFGPGNPPSGCADDVTLGDCQAMPVPNVFYAGESCPTACQAIGSCCNQLDGTCQDAVRQIDCDGLNETWTEGVACPDDADCRPRGACCNLATSECVELALQGECIDSADQWFPGLTCVQAGCESEVIPTVSEWGMVILALGLLVAAKAQFTWRGRWT